MIGLLISLATVTKGQDLPIPESTVSKVIDRLIVCEGYEYKLNKQDSVITVYKHKDSVNLEIIAQYKLNTTEYENIIKDLKELNTIAQAEKADLRRELRRAKIKVVLVTAANIVILVIVLL